MVAASRVCEHGLQGDNFSPLTEGPSECGWHQPTDLWFEQDQRGRKVRSLLLPVLTCYTMDSFLCNAPLACHPALKLPDDELKPLQTEPEINLSSFTLYVLGILSSNEKVTKTSYDEKQQFMCTSLTLIF